MYRTQIQLSEHQVMTLKRLAAARSISMAELIRNAVDQMVMNREPDAGELRRRAIQAAGQLHGAPLNLSEDHDRFLADAFENR